MDFAKLKALGKDVQAKLKPREKTVKPAPGKNEFIILPGWRKGEEHIYFHFFGQHFIKDEAGAIQAVLPCADEIYGQPCVVCDALKKAIHSTASDETVKALEQSKASKTVLLNALHLSGEDPATPVVLELKRSAFGQLVELVEEWGAQVFDAENPQIIQVVRDGKGLNTKYTVQISPKRHTLPKSLKLHNLDEYVAQITEEQKTRALTAVKSVAGIAALPAPKRSADTPVTPDADDDALRALEGSSTRVAEAEAAATSRDATLDAELDDLLKMAEA